MINSTSFVQRLVVLALIPSLAFTQSQLQKKDSESLDRKLQQSLPSTIQPVLPRAVFDAPVDPNKYFVGPSDVFAVDVWGSSPVSYTIAVTPEGTLIVPTVGEIKVADLTLAEVRRSVLAEIRKRYRGGQPTVTLISPRLISVKVSGDVRFPGNYAMYGSDRVEKAILEAGKEEVPKAVRPETDEDQIQRLEEEKKLRHASQRNIVVKHRNGSSGRVDLLKFYATREDQWNPYLKEGDEVFVPIAENPKRVIGVYGAVNQPDRYEFADGDSFLSAVALAHGFKVSAILDSVDLTRYDESGTRLTTRTADAKGILDGRQADIQLQPGDRIVVREREEFREDYRVSVEGEVFYPGMYPITRFGTKLSEIINRAGGVTPFAALSSAIIIRKSAEPGGLVKERLLSSRGNVQREDTLYVALETELRFLQGEYVRPDFERLLQQKDSTQDVVLQSEDRVVIPSVKKTVYVFGQVISPSHVPLVQGQDAWYYIKKAGGFTDRARTGDVVVIKRSSRQWLEPSETTIEDGDFVWVPKVTEKSLSYYLNIVGQAASILGATLTILVLYLQLQK